MTTQTSNTFSVSIANPGSIPAHLNDTNAPPSQWTAIGTNTVSQALGNFYTLNPPPSGFKPNLPGLFSGWSSACYDPVTHRLYVNGGGDNDYDGNEWYSFNLQTNAWTRHDDPTITIDPPPASPQFFSDGSPTPMHTYDYLGVNPNTGKCYSLLNWNHITMEWNPALAVKALQNPKIAWSQKVATPTGAGNIGSANAWAQDRGVFYVMWRDGGGFMHYSTYNPTTNQWSGNFTSGSHTAGVHYSTGAWDPTRKLFVVASNQYSFGLNAIEVANFTNSTPVFSQPTLSATRWSNFGGIKYDSVRDRFVYYSDAAVDRREMWSINPDTWVVTRISGQISGGANATPPVANSGAGDPGIFGRFQYCADYDVFIMVNNVSGSVYLYKPVGWTP